MTSQKTTIKKIQELTAKFQKKYPAVYEHLMENPITLPGPTDRDEPTQKELQEWLNSLREQWEVLEKSPSSD